LLAAITKPGNHNQGWCQPPQIAKPAELTIISARHQGWFNGANLIKPAIAIKAEAKTTTDNMLDI
jgi:hypothetical protein